MSKSQLNYDKEVQEAMFDTKTFCGVQHAHVVIHNDMKHTQHSQLHD